ncbi:DUF305 domain-containing protein [Streptomyces sp. SID13726]|uniref:DUF305 domain-containing protein n=1 Tax=Streptomyces sp. SID13726 TaxID=2706058 RepID=UPI0013BCC0F9|nr:DUF305 domain-containing protein [Streptomyces sp. SID13726]NEA98028.1 DUF305 domain-containing protein [Streptomyces sp. SID13726]
MRTTRFAALSVSAVFALAACGGGDGAESHNSQDVSFAQGMIPHHRQAVEMARLADGRASSSQVKDLAARVEKAQGPEIRTMSGWLKTWGEDVPSSMAGMDHSAHSGMAGMMDDADMGKLEKVSGKDFDSLFLTMMVEHHEGAVEMATAEKAKGEYKDATAMADSIVTTQNAEISEMRKLLGEK